MRSAENMTYFAHRSVKTMKHLNVLLVLSLKYLLACCKTPNKAEVINTSIYTRYPITDTKKI